MASSYPGVLDALNNPLGTDAMNAVSVPHATQHTNVNDAVEAIEAVLGVNPQGGSVSVAARLSTASYIGHVHAITDITSLSASLAGKANSTHTHAESDVTSLVADLAAKPGLSSTIPATLGVAAIGVGSTAARADHVHLLPTLATLGAAASTRNITAGSGLTGGGDLSADRTLAANFTTTGGDNGTAVTVARGDHLHDGRYYTQSQATTNFAATAHLHDSRYVQIVVQTLGTALPSAASYPEGTIVAQY
jgi:hypothetical protein